MNYIQRRRWRKKRRRELRRVFWAAFDKALLRYMAKRRRLGLPPV